MFALAKELGVSRSKVGHLDVALALDRSVHDPWLLALVYTPSYLMELFVTACSNIVFVLRVRCVGPCRFY